MKQRIIKLLRLSERFTKIDMVYLASGTFWGNINAGVLTLLSFIASVLFARYFTKEAYGLYQLVLSIASFITALTLTGMNTAVTRAVARGYEGEVIRSVKYQLKASFIPFSAALIAGSWYFYKDNNSLALVLIIVGILIPINGAFNTWAAYLGGKKIFRIGSYYGIINSVVNYGAIFIALYFSQNYLVVFLTNYVVMAIMCVLIYRHSLRLIPPNNKLDAETIPYGVDLSIMGVMGTIAAQLDVFLVYYFTGAKMLAIYSFATILPERMGGLLKFIPNIALPKLSQLNPEQVKKVIAKKIGIMVLLVSGAAGTYALISPFIFKTFFPAYTESIIFTQIYSLSFFSLIASILTTALISQKKTRELYIFNIAMPISRATLMSVLMFVYGVWGLLWAQILSNFISILFQLILLFKKDSVKNP